MVSKYVLNRGWENSTVGRKYSKPIILELYLDAERDIITLDPISNSVLYNDMTVFPSVKNGHRDRLTLVPTSNSLW